MNGSLYRRQNTVEWRYATAVLLIDLNTLLTTHAHTKAEGMESELCNVIQVKQTLPGQIEIQLTSELGSRRSRRTYSGKFMVYWDGLQEDE